MALTLRGMAESAWNVLKYANPITGPYFIVRDLAQNKTVQDSVKVATETTKAAAKSVSDAANVVLDYPIDQGAKQAYDATKRGVDRAVDATEEALETGARTVREGVSRGVEAVDEAQKEARRDVAEWIAPNGTAPAAPAPGTPEAPRVTAPASPVVPKPAPVSVPTTPAETRAFQEKFNNWLASDAGKIARDSGISPLQVDSVLGPLTKYALAFYNSRP